MIEQKGKQTLAELMQLGYDLNVIAVADMRGNREIEKQIDLMCRRIIKWIWDWYNTTDKVYKEDVKYKTVMRFCFTIGFGAAWFWENRRKDVDAKGLFECMAEPRTEFAMDEYIVDTVGIGWKTYSFERCRYRSFFNDCLKLIREQYDLKDKEQEHSVGRVMMLIGMHCGYTRIYNERAMKPYIGEMPWHWAIWKSLYGENEEDDMTEYDNLLLTTGFEGKYGLGVPVMVSEPESENGKTEKIFYPITYKAKAGVKAIVYEENETFKLLSATPIFDSYRHCFLIIEHVYVWKSGAEATIRAHFADDEGRKITFYDTDYLENKDKYYVGCGYIFDVYGIAYHAEIVPEDQRSFQFEGEEAINFNKKVGCETEYGENGVPEPVVFYTEDLHSFFQVNDKYPEDASFRSPISAVYGNIDYLGKKVYGVEIGLPYYNEECDKLHPLTVFIAADTNKNLTSCPEVGEPIHGIIYLQGKMRSVVNWNECPSTMLHTFDAKKKDGTDNVFSHICAEGEEGKPMTSQEQNEFAKEVYFQQMTGRIYIKKINSDDEEMPDFKAEIKRDIWVKADVGYTAASDFVAEKKDKYLIRKYLKDRNPIIAYVSLYDLDGNECQWLKGGKYKAKIHYGSVLPGQKMIKTSHLEHDELVKKLFESFDELDTLLVAEYLHKDLDFRSTNIPDPIITRDEYLMRTDKINDNNKKSKDGPVKAVMIEDETEGAMIELRYPTGPIDIVKVKTDGGFITEIRIEKK